MALPVVTEIKNKKGRGSLSPTARILIIFELSVQKAFPGHLRGLRKAHQLEYRRCDIGKNT